MDSIPDGRISGISLGGIDMTPRGALLMSERRPQGAPPLRLGVLGCVRGASAENLAQMERARRQLKRLGAQALVVLGGLDATYEGTRALLNALKDPGGELPILALPGEHESWSGFSAAVQNLGGSLVDLSLVRALVHPAATLMGVPGYHLDHHLLAGRQGCGFDAADLADLAGLAARLPGPRVLLSHGPPRGKGILAPDRGFGGANLGDEGLSTLMKRGGFVVSLSCHIHESGGRAVTLEGAPVAPGSQAGSLVLNVGSADATAHEDLQGRWTRGSAALVELDRGRARYRLIDLSLLSKSSGK